MQPLLAVGEDANHASPPVMPSVEPEVTTTGHGYSSELEHLAATHAPSRLFSEEEFALVRGHYKIHGRFRFVHAFLCATTYMIDSALRFPSVHSGGLTDASSWLGPGVVEDLEPYEQAVLPD
jgi:hypothetical protein